MFAFRSLLAIVPLVSVAIAQSAKIAFTSVPAVVVAGQSYNITWGGGDGSTVTITLRKGDPSDLATVGTLIDGAEGYSWIWNVSKSLNTSSDYALQITQGQSDINYSGSFAVVGGAGTSSISYSGLTTSTSNSSATMTAANSTMTGNSTTMHNNMTTTTASSSASRTGGPTFGAGAGSSSATASISQSTTAPSSNAAAVEMGSSAAFVMAIVAAMLYLH